jgi:hypothetical protein
MTADCGVEDHYTLFDKPEATVLRRRMRRHGIESSRMSDVVALNYDTLPALSNLRREIDECGNLRISIAAAEPGILARRAAMFSTAWVSVVLSVSITALLAAFLMPVFLANRAQTRVFETLLILTAGVFFSSMFLLVWWLEYRKRLEVIERAALQATVVSVTRDKLFIESIGPFGTVSETIAPPFSLFARRMPDSFRVECLHIVEREGRTTHVFPGLSHEELRWIAAEIRTAINTAA